MTLVGRFWSSNKVSDMQGSYPKTGAFLEELLRGYFESFWPEGYVMKTFTWGPIEICDLVMDRLIVQLQVISRLLLYYLFIYSFFEIQIIEGCADSIYWVIVFLYCLSIWCPRWLLSMDATKSLKHKLRMFTRNIHQVMRGSFTVNASSLICILKADSSEESTSSGNAMQSHHLYTDLSDSSNILQITKYLPMQS